jgi:thiamine pyrophosphate-dependent acetolactate synthase large subunit-like protein
MQLTCTEPKAPVYICLDVGLQEASLANTLALPRDRYAPAPAQVADTRVVEQVAAMLRSARNPLLLVGRASRSQDDWDRRVQLAERFGATVITNVLERSSFPTAHPLHPLPPLSSMTPPYKEAIENADVIVSLDWLDLNGLFQGVMRDTDALPAKVVHVSLDSHLHRGWSMDHFGLPPADVRVLANADRFVEQVLALSYDVSAKAPTKVRPADDKPAYSNGEKILPHDIEVALQRLRSEAEITLAHVNLTWKGDVFDLRGPLDFLGHDGGAGLAAGPGLTVGASLALRDSDRHVVSVMGDGDFLQGVTALWTAAHYNLPALFIVANNRSNFNDEIHQENVARTRGRAVENRWIGQRIDDPAVDIAGIARAQGIESEGPISTHAEMEAAFARGLQAVREGRPYLVDVLVAAVGADPSTVKRGLD